MIDTRSILPSSRLHLLSYRHGRTRTHLKTSEQLHNIVLTTRLHCTTTHT